MDKRYGKKPQWLKDKISKATKEAMARPEIRRKLVELKGNGNGFKGGKLNPMFGKEDDKSPNWKGNKAKYGAIHEWVKKHKGKAKICSICGDKKRIQWANVDHKYKRNLEDYISLCPRCHTRYDIKNNFKKFGKYSFDICEIKKYLKSGMSFRKIAKKLNVSSHHTIINFYKKNG
jgi:uncharacterized protein YlaI